MIRSYSYLIQIIYFTFFLVISSIMLCPLAGCQSTHNQYQKKSYIPPRELIDTWSVSVGINVRGSLHITNNKFYLSLSGGEASGYVTGYFSGQKENGWACFQFLEGKINNRIMYGRPVNLAYSDINGFFLYDRKRGNRFGFEDYAIIFTHNEKQLRSGNITRIINANLNGKKVPLGMNESKASFIYHDDTTGDSSRDSRFSKITNITHNEKRIQKFINSALHSGLNCGNVAEIVVRPGVVSRFNITRGYENALFKIVSPLGNDRLMYGIGSMKSGSAGVSSPHGFPSIVINQVSTNAFIDLWLLPEYIGDAKSESEIYVSIYYFSPNLLANRNNCQFFKTSTFSKLFTLGKVYFSIMMEISRSNANVDGRLLEEYISIYGRDVSIKSALEDLFPSADDSTISFMTRNIGSLLQNGFDHNSLAFANWRESIIQDLESRPSMKGESYRFIDILLDTSLFLGKKKNN